MLRNCLFCGIEFEPNKPKQKFCSDKHRVYFSRQQSKPVSFPIKEGMTLDEAKDKFDLRPALAQTIRTAKTFQDYLKEAPLTKNQISFREEVKQDKSLTPAQRASIYARMKQSTKP